MSLCVCYVAGNLFAKHNYGKFLQLVIKCTELVTTAGFFSVSSDLDLFREVKTFSGETEVFTSDYVIKKLFAVCGKIGKVKTQVCGFFFYNSSVPF